MNKQEHMCLLEHNIKMTNKTSWTKQEIVEHCKQAEARRHAARNPKGWRKLMHMCVAVATAIGGLLLGSVVVIFAVLYVVIIVLDSGTVGSGHDHHGDY